MLAKTWLLLCLKLVGILALTTAETPSEGVTENPSEEQYDAHISPNVNMDFDRVMCPNSIVYDIFGGGHTILAKLEDHPASDHEYTDVRIHPGYNFSKVLMAINMTGDTPIGNAINAVADIFKNGQSGMIFTSEIDNAREETPGASDREIMIFTFASDTLSDALHFAHLEVAAPFLPTGAYLDYDHHRRQTRLFGVAVGILLKFKQDTHVSEAKEGPYDENIPILAQLDGEPQLLLAFLDVLVEGTTRDFKNEDGDVISHVRKLETGSVLRTAKAEQFRSPIVVIGLDNNAVDTTVDILAAGAALLYEYNSSFALRDVHMHRFVNELGLDEVLEAVGRDAEITFRMGDGVSDGGMLHALASVNSGYAVFDNGYRRHSKHQSQHRNERGISRLKFTLFGCNTGCLNNATHEFINYPELHEEMTAKYDMAFTTNYITGYTSPTYQVSPRQDLFGGPRHNKLIGGLFARIQNLNVETDVYVNITSVISFDRARSIDLFDDLGAGAQEHVLEYLGFTHEDIGTYIDMREGPHELIIFGGSTGIVFFQAPSFHIINPIVPLISFPEVLIFDFSTGEEDDINNGYRVFGGSAYMSDMAHGSTCEFGVSATGIDLAVNYDPTVNFFGLVEEDDFCMIENYLLGSRKVLRATGLTHALSYYPADFAELNIDALLVPCWTPFADVYEETEEHESHDGDWEEFGEDGDGDNKKVTAWEIAVYAIAFFLLFVIIFALVLS